VSFGFLADSLDDHFHDRFKMLLLSHRQGDIFEELDFHIILVRGFVNLPELPKFRPKIRDLKYCYLIPELAAYQQLRTCRLVWHALCPLLNGWKELNSMNTIFRAKPPFTRRRRPDSERALKPSEKHAIALLCFFTTTGLLSVVADVFTNTVPMPAGLRDLWLVICVITFGLLLMGITLFFLSYKSKQPSTAEKE
jgi:hypothetical protein